MATCSNGPNPANAMDFNQNIPLSECMCPICMSILVEPVTLPCRHELCMPCFRLNIHETSMTCPMCRIRIATWSRQATRKNTLINQKRWNQIKRLFPEQVNKRLAGMDDDEIIRESTITPTLSEPGEIRKEYEEEMRKIQEERDRQRMAELEASETLIRKIQEEEEQLKESWKKRKTKQVQADEMVAKEILERLIEPPIRITRNQQIRQSGMDQFVRPGVDIHQTQLSQLPPTTSKQRQNRQAALDEFIRAARGIQLQNENQLSQPVLPSTSKQKPFDFFNPKVPSKSTDNKSKPSASTTISDQTSGKSGENIEFVTTECVATEVKQRPVASASKPAETDESQIEVSRPQKPKVSETAEVVRSFVDKRKIPKDAQPSTSAAACPRACSTDSISQELVHFQPIQACPRTPPKRLPGGRFIHAPIIKCKPLNIPSPEPVRADELTSTSKHHSPVIRRQVALLEAQRMVKVGEHSKAVETDQNILANRSPSSPFKTISIGQKRRLGIEKSPATKKLRFELDSDGSDNIVNGAAGDPSASATVNYKPVKYKPDAKPLEVIVIDSESTQSSCIIIEEKSSAKPTMRNDSHIRQRFDWLDSMGDDNNTDSDGMIPIPRKIEKHEPEKVYTLANRLRSNPPQEPPVVNKIINDWLKTSQRENIDQSGDSLRVNPIETARRCFSNPGRKLVPEVSKDYLLRRATDDEDRARSVCPVLKEQQENQQEKRTRKHQMTQMTLLKGKKVPNKDSRRSRGKKSRSCNTKTKGNGKAPAKTKVKTGETPSSGEEAGAESDDDADLKLAKKLQKQFDLEAKWGQRDEYEFRKRSSRSESSS